MQKGEFLKQRAEKFLKNAQYLYSNGDYDLAAFNLEQAAQFFIKYYLFFSVGAYPFSHSIKELLSEAVKVCPERERIEGIFREQEEIVRDLEEAYISSRYFPSTFFKDQIERMERLVVDIKKAFFNE